MRSYFSGGAFAVVGALALWGCGGSSGGGGSTTPTAPSTPSAQTVTVSIVASIGNQAYRPNPVSAGSGATVMFRNNDRAVHHIVMDDGSADLGDIQPGSVSRGFTVRNANATNFHCLNHPSMVGSINGASAPEPPPCADPYGYGC